MSIEENAIYTPAEVADLLRCGKTNIYDLISGGHMAVIRVGAGKKGFRVKGADILAFLSG
jgi:excisionase family DNA binding protein